MILVLLQKVQGGMSLGWKFDIDISLKCYSNNHVDVVLKELEDDVHWRLIDFYKSHDLRNRNESWHLLHFLGHDQSLPWLVCGDRRCGRWKIFKGTFGFSLEDFGFEGPWFT